MIRDKSHLPLLSQRGDQKNAFHPGEAFADATAQTTAKGEIRNWDEFGASESRLDRSEVARK